MWIQKIHAYAFGPLAGEEMEFEPGMNVVFGPNEAGKSSWHGALYASLCGMRRGRGRPRKEEQEFIDRHKPWDGDAWEVGCRIELADGRKIELRHDLADYVDCRAVDLTTGADISDQLLNEQTPDGSKLLGLTREVVPSTLCVRQSQVLAVLESPEQLQIQLQAAAASGGENNTAEAAIRQLEKFRKTAVGTSRTRTAPLDRKQEQLRHALQLVSIAEDGHREFGELVRQHAEAEEAAKHSRAKLLKARLDVLGRRLKRVRELAADLPEEIPELHEDQQLVRKVSHALSLWEARPGEPEPLEGPTARELEEELVRLPKPPDGDTDVHRSVEEARDEWREACARLGAHREQEPGVRKAQAAGGLNSAELRQLAEGLETNIPEVDAKLMERVAKMEEDDRRIQAHRATMPIGAALIVLGLLLVGLGATKVGVLLAAVGIGLAGWGWWLTTRKNTAPLAQLQAELAVQKQLHTQATQRRDSAQERVRAAGLPSDPAQLRSHAEEIDAASSASVRRRDWKERLSRLEEAVVTAEQGIRNALAARGFEIGDLAEGGIVELLDDYRKACARRADQAKDAARAVDLENRLEARRAAERAAEEQSRRRANAAQAVVDSCRAVELETTGAGDPDMLVEALSRWRDEYEAELERLRVLHRRRAALEALLDGRSIDDLEEEAAGLRSRLAHLSDPGPVEIGADPQGTLADLEERANDAAKEAAELAGKVAKREETLLNVAEAQERVARLQDQVDQLQRLGQTVDATLGFLERARDRVQRDIAPRLARAVELYLPRITGGRYREATVDPDQLRVQVRDGKGRLRPAMQLSHGTAEQVYLLLRLAMTEHLVTTEEPAPLVLDDVTVQSDRHRTLAFLDLLHELSTERQIILFSQEDEVLEWARGHLTEPNNKIIELHPIAS